MAPSRSRTSSPLRRRRGFLLMLSLYLLLGLAFAAPASAEHLSHKHSHARKSLEHDDSLSKRDAARPANIVRQQDKRAIAGIGIPGLGSIQLGGDGGLLGLSLLPNTSTSASASATSTSSSSDSASTTSSSTSQSTSTASTNDASTSASSSPSDTSSTSSTPSSATLASTTSDATSSSSDSSSSDITSTSAPSTRTTATPSTSSECIGLLGIDLVCTPVSTPSSSISSGTPSPASSVVTSASTTVASGGSNSGSNTSSGGSDSTTPTGSSPSSGTTSSGAASAPPPSSFSTTSEQCDGVLSLDLLGNPLCVLPTGGSSSTSANSPASTTASDSGSVPPSNTGSSIGSSPSSSTDATSSSTCEGLLCGILPSSTSQAPSSTESGSATTSSCTGLLCGILPPPTTSTTESSITGSGSGLPSQTSDSGSGSASSTSSTCSGLLCSILPPVTSTESASNTATASAPSDTSSSCVGLLCSITSGLGPTETTTAPGENSTTTTPPEGSNSTTTTTDGPITTPPPSNVTTTTPPINGTTTTAGNETSITFPTGNTTVPASTTSLITLTPTTISTEVPSQFSFLTQSSLLISDVPTSSSSSLVTLTNPDEPTSSATLASVENGATVTSVPLPSGLPARIYPAEGGVSADTDLSDYTSVSILFDKFLGWDFVAKNTDSAAQLFAYFPPCLQVALGISADQVKTFALQVWETSSYKSTADVSELQTLFLAYIPSDNVTALEQAIKAKQSDLYTKTTGISNQLAQRIDASYSVTSYPDPISEDPGSSNDSESSSSSSRRDAIIGVCSALGGIALCILVFLVYRNYKRRQEAAHRRLSDPHVDVGPVPGQDFDRDSIGGQRRRSFYYASDSLRGYSQPPYQGEAYAHHISPVNDAGGVMRERRPIAPGTISAPILRDNTLNW